MKKVAVSLINADPFDFHAFKRDLRAAFAIAVVEELGEALPEPIPFDAGLDQALAAPNAVALVHP